MLGCHSKLRSLTLRLARCAPSQAQTRCVGVSEEDAFISFNLAPLCARRGIAILGCIHRASLQQGPPGLWKFFCRNYIPHLSSARRRQRHSFQIAEWPSGRDLQIMRRSALGMIRVYNLLPQEAAEKTDVEAFQSALTQLLRDRLIAGDPNWRLVFSPRIQLFQYHPLAT